MSKEDKALKGVELKLISELMMNSKRSDREIAKAIGVSQPTVSRTMAKLEKEGVLREYTVIPDFRKIGYNLAAITLGNVREDLRKPEKIDAARREFVKNFDDVSFEIVLDVRGMGMEHDGAIFSFHRNYSEYADFRRRLLEQPSINPSSLESFLIDLNAKNHHRHFTLSYLARHLLQAQKSEDKT